MSHLPVFFGHQQPDLSKIDVPGKLSKFRGYYNIARHYKWALEQVFMVEKHNAVIVVEGRPSFHVLDLLNFCSYCLTWINVQFYCY